MKNQELEVKFYISDLAKIEEKLRGLAAEQVQPRVHEMNLRFDTAEGELRRTLQVLRLRQDQKARLTYKGPGTLQDGVRLRKEIEFIVSDFEAARALFESLGFIVSMFYEKYRAMYKLEDVVVTLDEMPYGNFIEIEGPNPDAIYRAGERLGLEWERRIVDSYTVMFDRLRQRRGLPFQDLSFEHFKGLDVAPEDLGVSQADSSGAQP